MQLNRREFAARIRRAYQLLQDCCLCPRRCHARRSRGQLGHCRCGVLPLISSCTPHHGEEPPLSGTRGSGAIFFSRCNLNCCFCQNYPISQLGHGREVSVRELAQMMLKLQQQGCHNINLVTPTPWTPQIIQAVKLAADGGLFLPIVYNSGGYDSLAQLRLLDGIVDIYLPDMKYAGAGPAASYSGVSDYPRVNRRAVMEMQRQVGVLQLDGDGLARRGLIIRHLVLPNGLAGSKSILHFIAEKISPATHVSLMGQYFPAYRATRHPELARRISIQEYTRAAGWLEEFGLGHGWLQECVAP